MTTFDPTTRYTFSIPEVATILGISRTSAYAAVSRGDIASLRIGGRLLVTATTLNRMLGPPHDSGQG